jgi:hypothetical protein
MGRQLIRGNFRTGQTKIKNISSITEKSCIPQAALASSRLCRPILAKHYAAA